MLRSFITRCSASASAAAPRVCSSRASSALRCTPRRGLMLSARTSSSALPGRGSLINSSSGSSGGESEAQRGFARSSAPLASFKIRQQPPSAASRTQLHSKFKGFRVSPSQTQTQQQPEALSELSEFFIAPIASQPLSWSQRFRFLSSEASILAVSLGVGYAATKAASESLAHLIPDVDALVLVFGSSGLWMPVSIVSYLALLRLLRSQGVAFAQPPPPCTRRGLRRLFKSTLAGKMGSESLIAWIVGAIAVATSLSVALRLVMMPRMAPMDEASLDDQWTPTFVIGLLGPISEEVLFRALLFARCARFIGVAPAALFSGIAFGLMHGSDAPSAAQKGMLYGILYSVTGSILVPIAMHVCWNSALEFGGHRLSPMAPLDSVAAAFDTKFGGLKQMGLSTEAHEGEMFSALQTWLLPETAPAPQPADPAVTRSVFNALDCGDKGYLDASEIAWLMTLQESELEHLEAVLHVIQRRVRGNDKQLDAVQRNMERMPASIPLLEIPSAPIGTGAEATVIQPIHDSQQMLTKDSVTAAPLALQQLQHRNAVRLETPVDSRAHALRAELLHRYYSVQWNAFYRAQFPDGCTAQAFEAFFARSFGSSAERARILAALRSSTESTHPVAAMIEAHRSGKHAGASR